MVTIMKSIIIDNIEKAKTLYNRGLVYLKGKEVPIDYEKAIEFFKLATINGDGRGFIELGYMYQVGIGVEKNYQKAFRYYSEANKMDASLGLYELGYIYRNGLGVKTDYQKALEYFVKAFINGNIEAAVSIGYMYLTGYGVKQDCATALKYYQKALSDNKIRNEVAGLIIRIKYCDIEENLNYLQLFEYGVKKHPKDLYTKNIKENLENGSKVYIVENIKELTKEVLDKLPQNTIINIRNCYNPTKEFYKEFYTISDIRKILYICNEVLNDIPENQSEEDIFMQIYIKACLLFSYDESALNENKEEKLSSSRNLSIFLSKQGVCGAEAEALKALLNLKGIECNRICSENHAYNQVKLNGKWYYCDITNDNPIIKEYRPPEYCLQSEHTFTEYDTHTTISLIKEEALEDYLDIEELYNRNYNKLFGINPKIRVRNK